MMRESDLEIWRLQNKESEVAVFSVASQPKYDKNMFTFSSAKESTFTLYFLFIFHMLIHKCFNIFKHIRTSGLN